MTLTAILDRPDDPVAAPEPQDAPRKRGGGPKTAEGRDRAKRNALKHGLMAREVFPDDLAAAVRACIAELVAEFRPASPYEMRLVVDMGRAHAQIDRCEEQKLVDLQRSIDRARTCWDSDRRASIDALAARLPGDPARIARALEGTKQGADWLVARWEGLSEVLQSNGTWDETQRRLAFDLRGVPLEFRDGSRQVPAATDAAALAALVAGELDRLRDHQEATLLALDEASQAMAAAGMLMEEDAATRRLRQYEARARRVLNGARGELLRVRAGGESSSSSSPSSPAPLARPFASGAAADYQFQRYEDAFFSSDESDPSPARPAAEPSFLPVEIANVAETPDVAEAETAPIAERTVAAEVPNISLTPAVVGPSAVAAPAVVAPQPARVMTSRSMQASPAARDDCNRRARRAREKRARKAARHGGR